VGAGALAGARQWLHYLPDQGRARLLFGRVQNATCLVGWLCAVPWLHYHPPEGPELVSAGTVTLMAMVWFLSPI